MLTRVLAADSPEAIHIAADLILHGSLVAYPTDTVYGLGGLGLSGASIASIFRAKGRPQDRPIPLLISRAEDMLELAEAIPIGAWLLAAEFWPGALTIVLRKAPRVPSAVAAGGLTVALRVPDHPVTLALIRDVGGPIAGTSANRSGEPSNNTAAEVLAQLGGSIEAILDGGRSPGGVESTVLDLSTERPRLLRQGPLDISLLQDVLEIPIEL